METTAQTTAAIVLTPDLALLVDELGFLQNQADALKTAIKANGAGSYLGTRYVSKVIHPADTEKTDWETIAMHFSPSRQLITAHTKMVPNSPRITTTLQKGKA